MPVRRAENDASRKNEHACQESAMKNLYTDYVERGIFRVYVVKLTVPEEVLKYHRKQHPKYDGTKPVVYVGETKWAIEERLREHLKKPKSLYASRWVHYYYERLMPELY